MKGKPKAPATRKRGRKQEAKIKGLPAKARIATASSSKHRAKGKTPERKISR